MRQIKLIIAALFLMSPFAASAVPITTSLGEYDIATVTGTFDDVAGDLMAQDWWGDAGLAAEFRDVLGLLLGYPGNRGYGYTPIFAYGGSVGGNNFGGFWIRSDFGAGGVGGSTRVSLVWAVGQRVAVPEPGTLALLGIGLLGMGAARRRKKA